MFKFQDNYSNYIRQVCHSFGILQCILIAWIVLYPAGKSDEDEEEGTISRPGSPKEGDIEDAEKMVKESGTSLAREISSATVRIGRLFAILLFFRQG